jgi:LysM repeat protein
MYKFLMGKVLLPIPPSKMQTTINNQNKTVNLMNEGEVNVIKTPGLTSIKFDIILPLYTWYPFADYDRFFQPAGYYLQYFEKLKYMGTPFSFIVNRFKEGSEQNKKNIMLTNMLVVLENYTVTESKDNAPDVDVSIELKEYKNYGTIIKKFDILTNNEVSRTIKKNKATNKIPSTYTVKKGDTLWAIAKKLLGDGAKCWNLAKLNKISNPNKLFVGQVLKIQDVKATSAPASAPSKSSSPSKTNSSSNTNTSTKPTTTTVKTITPSAAKNSPKMPDISFLYMTPDTMKDLAAINYGKKIPTDFT